MAEERLKELLKPLEQQIESLRDLNAEQIGNLRENIKKDISLASREILDEMSKKLEDRYVSREYLATTLLAHNEKYQNEINKIYAKYDPIRTVLLFIATTVGGVLLVAVAAFLFNGSFSGTP